MEYVLVRIDLQERNTRSVRKRVLKLRPVSISLQGHFSVCVFLSMPPVVFSVCVFTRVEARAGASNQPTTAVQGLLHCLPN